MKNTLTNSQAKSSSQALTFEMIEEAIRQGQATFSNTGAVVTQTGKHTGRAANNRFLVKHESLANEVDWGPVNIGLNPEFSALFFSKLQALTEGRRSYSMTGFAGPFPIRVHSSSPWHIAFAQNMFRNESVPLVSSQVNASQTIEIYHAPYDQLADLGLPFETAPELGGIRDTLILLDPVHLRVGIIGTAYAGEIKKSAFTLCNFKLPEFNIFPMHASANCLEGGDSSCVLFGLSGTGKTTLSAAPDRALIGDDEIVWTSTGISNLEGGCYAKLIDLSATSEPEIFSAVNRFGAIQENVACDPLTREVDFSNHSKTENTRGSYPLSFLPKTFDQSREAEVPESIVFLMADAFGAMPAVALLTPEQAQYHFISGYTAKVAGTELGVKEPKAAFSACYGAPFMPRHPGVYAKMLSEYASRAKASVWILNTGWTGGPYGVGKRFPIAVSRRILQAIQSGELAREPMQDHPVFGFKVPTRCPDVDAKFLQIPTGEPVLKLAEQFKNNFKKFAQKVDPMVAEKGGPLALAGSKSQTLPTRDSQSPTPGQLAVN